METWKIVVAILIALIVVFAVISYFFPWLAVILFAALVLGLICLMIYLLGYKGEFQSWRKDRVSKKVL